MVGCKGRGRQVDQVNCGGKRKPGGREYKKETRSHSQAQGKNKKKKRRGVRREKFIRNWGGAVSEDRGGRAKERGQKAKGNKNRTRKVPTGGVERKGRWGKKTNAKLQAYQKRGLLHRGLVYKERESKGGVGRPQGCGSIKGHIPAGRRAKWEKNNAPDV